MNLGNVRARAGRVGRGRLRVFSAALLAAGAPVWAGAQEWQVTPSVSGSVVYNDNINLASEAQAEDDLSVVVSPSVTARRTAGRTDIVLDYTAHLRRSLDDNGTDVSHELLGIADVEVVDDFFFVDARASVDQYLEDAFGVVGEPIFVSPGDQRTVATLSLTPTIRSQFGNWAAGQASYQIAAVQSWNDEGQLSDSTSHQVSAGVVSGPRFARLRWAGNASARRVYFSGDRNETTTYNLSGQASYAVTQDVAAIVGGGWERFDDPTLTDDVSGVYGYGGFDWHPSPRTHVELLAGQRYDQTWWSLDSHYDVTARTRLVASYNESLETVQTLEVALLEDVVVLDPEGNPLPPEAIREALIRAGLFEVHDRAFLRNRANVGFTTDLDRTSIGANAFWERRDFDGAAPSTRAWGVNGFVSRELAPDTSGTFTVRYRTEEGTGDSQSWGGALNVSHEFNPTLSGGVTLAHNRVDADGADDADQNIVMLTLRKSF